jgi:HEAT repeat protein
MRKRRSVRLTLAIAVVVAAVVFLFPAVVYTPLGLLRGEAFFDGRPTNYWARWLKQERFLGHAPPAGDAGKALREGGEAAVPVLCDIAKGPDEELRSEALRALSMMGPAARAAAPDLQATLKTETNSTRFLLAADALAQADPSAAATALAAVARDKGEDAGRRAWALTSLVNLGPEGREALPALEALRTDPGEPVVIRVEAVRALWHMRQPAEPLVATLCEVLGDERGPAGVQALEALQEMGPAARPALPVLLKLLSDPHLEPVGQRWGPPHRAAVVRTLGKMGPEAAAAVPGLVALLDSNNYYLHREVAQALDLLGPPARQALMTRDAAAWASVALLAARPSAAVAALPLVPALKKDLATPRDVQISNLLREAARKNNEDADARAGEH